METSDHQVMDQRLFALPGTVHVEAGAMALGRAFLNAAKAADPTKDWILAFDWADDRRVRRPGTNQWVVMGAGLDVCVFERNQLPNDVIFRIDNDEFVAKIKPEILDVSNKRTIGVDPRNPNACIIL